MKRKSVAEKRAEQEAAGRNVWREFFPALQQVQSYEEAVILLNQAPREGSPGRGYYSNFGFFMHYFAPPIGASQSELREYLRLIRCFDDQGILKPGGKQSVEIALTEAIKQRSERGY